MIKVVTARSRRHYQQLLESYCLIFVAKGTAIMTIGERQYRLSKENIYLCSPQESLGFKIHLESNASVYLMNFDVIYKNHPLHVAKNECLFVQRIDGIVEKVPLAFTEEIANLCGRLFSLSESSLIEDQLMLQAQFYMLIHAIVGNQLLASKDQQKMLEKTKDHMQFHFRESIQIKDLAKMMNISSKYYMELFRKRYGMSAIQYLTKVRIEASKWLLIKGGKTLREIASEVGYKDEFYFSRRFKQELGVSPSVFMKSREKKIAVLDSTFFGLLAPLHFIPAVAPIHPTWRFYYYKLFGEHVPIQLSIGRNEAIVNENIELLLHENTTYDFIFCLDNVKEEQLTKLQKLGNVYRIPTEDSFLKECEGQSPASRLEMNVGWR